MSRLYSRCFQLDIFKITLMECFSTGRHKVRLFAAAAPTRNPKPKYPEYTGDTTEYKTGRKYAIMALEKLLKVDQITAAQIVMKHRNLYSVNASQIKKNLEVLRKNGANHETLLVHPQVLALCDVEAKLKSLLKLPFDINEVLILLLLPAKKLNSFVKQELGSSKSKIATLSKIFDISTQEACRLLVKKQFLLNSNTERLENTVGILQYYGIAKEDILSDIWVVRYSKSLIEVRLKSAQEKQGGPIKTWMVRAEPKVIQHYFQKRLENKSILGDNSICDYLSRRLKCSKEDAAALIEKQPSLKNKNVKKLKELLDFLFSSGFTSDQIQRAPKVLVHSMVTIQERLKLLRDAKTIIYSPSILIRSRKEFNRYYESIGKTNNRDE